jgi:hypothetical protein
MTRIAESIRRNHKLIILGMALGVVALYMLPLDQIFAASTPISRVASAFESAKQRIVNNNAIPGVCIPNTQDCTLVKGNIINQLNLAQYHVLRVLQLHGF